MNKKKILAALCAVSHIMASSCSKDSNSGDLTVSRKEIGSTPMGADGT